jgi:hypothetical protein
VYTRLLSITPVRKDGAEATTVDMRFRDNDVGGSTATSFAKLFDVNATFSAYMDSSKTADKLLSFDEGYFNHTTDLSTTNGRAGYNRGVPIRFDDPSTGPVAVDIQTTIAAANFYASSASALTDAQKNDYIALKRKLAASYSMSFGKPHYWDVAKSGDLNHPNWNEDYTVTTTAGNLNASGVKVPKWDGQSDSGVEGFGLCTNPRNNGREVAVVLYYTPPIGVGGVEAASTRNARITVSWLNIHVK